MKHLLHIQNIFLDFIQILLLDGRTLLIPHKPLGLGWFGRLYLWMERRIIENETKIAELENTL